jgi:copper chaperone CopZ
MTSERIFIPVYDFDYGGGAARSIERALAHVPGVTRAYINPATGTACVEYDATQCEAEQIITAIEFAGFRSGALSVG